MKKLILIAAIMILAAGTLWGQTTLTLSDDSLTTATGAYRSAMQAYPYKWDITKGDVILQGIIDLGGIQAHVNTWDPNLGDPDDFFGLWGQIGLSKDPVFNSSDGVWFVTVEWLGGGDDSLTEIREILHMQEEPGTQPMPKLYTEPRTIAGGDGDDTLTFELQIHSTGATTGWAKLWIHGVLIEGDMWSVFDPDSLDFTGEDLSNAHVLVGVISGNNPNNPAHTFYWSNLTVTGYPASYSEVWVDSAWVGTTPGTEVEPGKYFGFNAFAEIQDGIDAVAVGGTVYVAAGTYYEEVEFDNTRDGIMLRGANAGTPGTDSRMAESVIEGPNDLEKFAIDILDGADGVIVDGFTLKAGDDIVNVRSDNVIIKNNIVTPSASPVTTNAPGIFACECDNFTASYNWILNIGPGGGCGMFLGLASFSADITNSLIAHNLIESSGGAGILINYASGTGINTVEYNEIKNVGHDGIRAGGEAHGTTIEHNEIYGSARDGVRIMADAASHHINYNSIYSSVAYGVNNLDAAATLDASGNWWGDNTATGVAGEVSTYVDYTPWLDSGTDTDPGPGFQGDFSVLDVDDDSPQFGTTTRIQEGVDLVTGSTVNVMAGTYEEQVVVSEDLTLAGAGKETTVIQSPITLTEYFTTSANNYPIVYIHDANVTIEDFTIDGLGRGNANYRFNGIGFWNAGGSVTNVRLTGVRDTPFSGTQHGVGIYAYNNTGGPYTIDLSGVAIDDFQKNATALSGDGLTANFSNCTVIGHGLTDVTAQNGIQIGFGAGGTVTDCSVSDIAYNDTTWGASAMLFYQAAPVNVNGSCSVTNSQSGIVFHETNGSVEGATILASDANNKEEGISVREYGETKASGSGLSIAAASPLSEEWQYKRGQSGAATTVALSNLSLTGAHQELSYGIGVWAIGDDINVTVTKSTIQDWGIGVVAKDSIGDVTVVADSNTISGNDFGVWTNSASAQDFENNNWGASDGPEDPDGIDEASIGQCYSVSSMKNTVAEFFPAEGLGNGVSDNVDYCPWIPWSCCVVRGNVDHMETIPGTPIDVADLTYLVNYLFMSGPPPPCEEEGNVDAIETTPGVPIDVADVTYLVFYMFLSGPPPPPC